jgi:putative restriction endonuclease
MPDDVLHKYIRLWDNLHRCRNPKWGGSPHKPILLLAVLDEIDRGHIATNRIELNLELIAVFRDYWRALVAKGIKAHGRRG